MITGKQRSYLKGLANKIDAMSFIGKDGLTDNVVSDIDKLLDKRELVKVKIQESALLNPKEVCEELASRLDAEFVQAIGRKFTLYRKAREEENRKIVLPK